MTIYGIPGLGADERVFQYLSLEIVPVQWLPPEKHESLQSYVRRLLAQIDQKKPFIVLGVSFGGMVAVEMNKFINPQQTIIISSAATRYELPYIAKVMRKTGMLHLLPAFMLKPPSFLANHFFGLHTAASKKLLREIIKDSDARFNKWAIRQIIKWKNDTVPPTLIRIHGDKDRLIKMQKGIEYKVIKGGGHLMIVEQAQEVEAIVKELLS